MSRLPIRLRLTLAFAAAMAVVLALLGFLLYRGMESALDRAVERNLRDRAADVAAVAQHGNLAGEGQTFAQVLDRSGRVVGSTAELDRPLLRPADVARAEASGAFFVDRRPPNSDEIARLFVMPVDAGGVRRAVVVGESLEAKGDALENLLLLLLVGGPLLLVLSSLGAYLLAGRALRPVSELLGRLEVALARERRFVSDASHELRTPLAALRTELELALRRGRTPEELEAALRSAAEETERLSQLAEDLLVLARAEGGSLPVRREELQASELLADVRERYARRASEAARPLEIEDAGDLRLSADRLRLEQALGNLVENALRHGRGPIRLSAERRNGVVAFHVRDGGAGFPPDFLRHAFEPFARDDAGRASPGAGLGLAIVDVIARAHGGSARAANGEGGTDVWLELADAPARR